MSSEGPRRAFRWRGSGMRAARDDVDEELRFHLDRCVEERVAEGWPEDDARCEVERRFGDVEATRDYCARQMARAHRTEERRMGIDGWIQDVAYALRTLRRAPMYSAVVLSTLAVGIALNTLVFSVMNPYLLRPLPYHAPERLVHLGGIDRLNDWDMGRFSAAQIEDLGARTHTLDGVAGYYYGTVNLAGEGGTERVQASWVTGGLFSLLGVDAATGRVLGLDDDHAAAPDVVVVGQDLWVRRFGADPDLPGSTIRLDGIPHTVVGIAPADFNFPFNAVQLWLPMRADPVAQARASMGTLAVARLAEGRSAEEARDDLDAIHAELAASYPEADGTYAGIAVLSLRESLNFAWDILRPSFALLLAGVASVLIIACVNVASLTLARASTRTREVAVRAAVGAGRGRIVRQLVVESLILAAAGGVLGIVLAHLATGLLAGIIPAELYRVGEISVDGRVLAFAVAITLVTPLVFGLAPAVTSVRRDLASALKEGGSAGDGRATLRGRRILVLAEVALAVVLVTATGLMVRSLGNALSTDLGFEADSRLVLAISPPAEDHPDAASLDALFGGVMAELGTLPGVTEAGTVSHLPLNHETIPVRYTLPGSEDVPLEQWASAYTSRAGPAYFQAMGIPILQGRAFVPEDGERGSESVVVSEGLARRLWPGQNALGRTFVWGTDENATPSTVVGVVADVRYDDLAGSPRPHVYRPLVGTATRRRFVVLAAAGATSAESLVPAVRTSLRAFDPDLGVEIRPMMDIVKESTGLWALSSVFLAAFGLVAMALAALGIYGVIAFSVAQRRREMGLRMALGADGRAIGRAVLGEGLKLTAIGLAIGVVLAVGAAYLLSGILFGVRPLDPVTLVGASGLFGVVAILASLLPALRATGVNPVQVLRSE